ncbi:hypothetical protein [Nonlabens xiamenensis]|uniref:hypothetical protein n=1 Tax=Nonlabens xiamenensis TaxID=2341043 RepID=UPI000F612511|nr:hypothetical protein [Nonlabens xiamenensis]
MKKIAITAIFILCWMGTQAQDSRRDKIKALSVAYITEQIDLTTEEAQEFWPIYNRIKETCHKMEREKREFIRSIEGDLTQLSDKEAAQYVKKLTDLENGIHKNRLENNNEEIIEIIGYKRFLMLTKAEHDFKRRMIREYKERRRKKE